MQNDGLLLIDKEPNCTSHDVVRRVRSILRIKKIGHCGTLDPAATGLLLLTVGKGTRLTRFLIHAPKEYTGEVTFGQSTDTYDADGTVVSEADPSGVSSDEIREAMTHLEGSYDQAPPPYCAKKIGGKKYYELARAGKEVPIDPKPVVVRRFQPIGVPSVPRISFELGCSSGTYARSLAHDLGQSLGCGAHLSSLRRTAIGNFHIDNARTLEQLEEADLESIGKSWIPFDEIPLPFSTVAVQGGDERRLLHGQSILANQLDAEEGDWVRLANGRGRCLAIGSVTENIGTGKVSVVQPKIVFPAG